MDRRVFLGLCAALLVSVAGVCSGADETYQREVTVREATRLDWAFALSNQSALEPPAEWLTDYESTRQRYELFIPAGGRAASKSKKGKSGTRDALPLVLFISPGDDPAGWSQLQSVCQQRGIAFASPYGAGNNTPTPRRVRLILDVLDDIRRNHSIDPDRTYLAGFSGGGRIACAIGFALPELFGGIMPVCAAGDLREETWLRHRAIDRLSLALITGETDFNRGEVERFRGPQLSEVGIRTQVTVVPKLGHGIPDAKAFANALEWLDEGAANRRKLATQFPASRIDGAAAPSREDWAAALLKEGQTRLKNPKTLYAGLMQLQGLMHRWPDLPAADEAKTILTEYESRAERPWEEEDVAEQRKYLIARARALTAYATGDLPDQYAKQRGDMLKAAANLWNLVIEDGQDAKAVAEGKKRLKELQERMENMEE